MNDMKNTLNDAQLQAVTYSGGPELVIAGAGSGKTTVLTHKIVYLLQAGYDPRRILALTFTNKAASEMKNRIKTLLGADIAKFLNVGTFHSIFMNWLKHEIKQGYMQTTLTSGFTVYDDKSSERLLKEIIEKMQLDEKVYDVKSVAERISCAKNKMLTPGTYGSSELYEKDVLKQKREILHIYEKYAAALRRCNAMDFDDLLLNLYHHFRQNDVRRQCYANRLQYILVDEYQDTNLVQKAIIKQLAEEKQNLFAVGDDAQSIYAFRGAVIENILHFEEDFPKAVHFNLEQNYRSTQNIVLAANSLIKANTRQRPKNLFSLNEQGDKVVVGRFSSDTAESKFVVSTIKEMVDSGNFSYGDFAVLYRNNSLSRIIEKELIQNDVSYVIYGGLGFFQRREIQDMFAYFRAIIFPDDDFSLKRIINTPNREIGDTTLTKLVQIADANHISLWKVLSNSNNYSCAIKRQRTRDAIARFVALMERWRSMLKEDAYSLTVSIVEETDMINVLKESDLKKNETRTDNLYQLLRDVSEYVSECRQNHSEKVFLQDYIDSRALYTDEEDKDKLAVEDVSVKLITVHKSKGLEFPVVFVIGMEENLFPSKKSLDSVSALEEERRLCYVAITRAKKNCFLTMAFNRYMFGSYQKMEPSEFIYDIDSKYLSYLK